MRNIVEASDTAESKAERGWTQTKGALGNSYLDTLEKPRLGIWRNFQSPYGKPIRFAKSLPLQSLELHLYYNIECFFFCKKQRNRVHELSAFS